jgi:hypothetical protein
MDVNDLYKKLGDLIELGLGDSTVKVYQNGWYNLSSIEQFMDWEEGETEIRLI